MKFKKLLSLTFLFVIFSCATTFRYSTFPKEYLTKTSREIHENFWGQESMIFGYLMENTQFQTPIFHFKSGQDGPIVLILGGTHGNEPAGFEAAHRLLEQFSKSSLKKGQIFIIPEANKLADYNQNRRIPVPKGVDIEFGNLNRCYPGNPDGLPMEQVAYEITQLIKKQKVNLFLDLHESPVFHMEQKSKTSEYHGLGQTLIYTPNEKAAWLGMVVIDFLNDQIPPGNKQFSMIENPIKHSAAWSAGINFNIPGFTVETCKKLPLEERVRYQMDVVNVMLKEMGMI
ncbi:succinylglutamate desuccinylase/aspartoacylase family protein [candidate division KSB1 bacterium]|nr:succinylglutamate desuccinylase/aspartoacylase family protein [candidate division KSB1 bacterium]